MVRARPAGPASAGVSLSRRTRWLAEVTIGLLLGALASVTGLMMSSLRVPMMVRVLKIDPKVAVGSNMAIGFVTALVGAVTSLSLGGGFDPLALAFVGPPTMLGSYLGALLTGRLRKEAVQRLLGWTIAFMGLFMVGQGAWLVAQHQHAPAVPASPADVLASELEDEPVEDPFD
jgi:uncharacterized membrane protein YfcA